MTIIYIAFRVPNKMATAATSDRVVGDLRSRALDTRLPFFMPAVFCLGWGAGGS